MKKNVKIILAVLVIIVGVALTSFLLFKKNEIKDSELIDKIINDSNLEIILNLKDFDKNNFSEGNLLEVSMQLADKLGYKNETAEGDDIIRGSQGNDNIVSVFGNDTYIFNKGDGNDIVSDFKGNDTIYFGDGITWADLSFIKEKDDMLITIDDTKDSILIKDWFKNEDNIIENFEFKTGMAHRANEIKIE